MLFSSSIHIYSMFLHVNILHIIQYLNFRICYAELPILGEKNLQHIYLGKSLYSDERWESWDDRNCRAVQGVMSLNFVITQFGI